MSRSEKIVVPGQEQIAPKISYEKPSVTTFGSVAKLTMGGRGSGKDGIHTKHQ